MAILQSTNVQGTLCVNGVAVGGGKDFKFCCFTASSTFTPSQDLVDGNAFVSADIVGGGGGGGAFAHWVRTTTDALRCFNSDYGNYAGVGGFIQDPFLEVSSTDTINVAVGAGGTAGCIEFPESMLNSTSPVIDDFSSSAATAGGDSCFGAGNVAYGGQGGTNVRHICKFTPAYSVTCTDAGGAANANALSYCGYGNATFDFTGCDFDNSGLHGLDLTNNNRITAACLQNGGSVAGGKIGASGAPCGQGHRSTGLAVPGRTLISTGGSYCVSCGIAQGCYGYTCDCRHCSGSTPGTPGGAFHACQRFNDNVQHTKFVISSSYGPGADGIVVINWAE